MIENRLHVRQTKEKKKKEKKKVERKKVFYWYNVNFFRWGRAESFGTKPGLILRKYWTSERAT